ncbi:uncharacterized protein LOC106674384 [Cimex lectularius]|uniref:Uncharacterized protein n=1 Tax=Cimex lectularius TaxID=79782 RepID=A0A8I6SCD5_CIMLE|nr:uncharacterized protein LOC106674384 [Cimex lectularius]
MSSDMKPFSSSLKLSVADEDPSEDSCGVMSTIQLIEKCSKKLKEAEATRDTDTSKYEWQFSSVDRDIKRESIFLHVDRKSKTFFLPYIVVFGLFLMAALTSVIFGSCYFSHCAYLPEDVKQSPLKILVTTFYNALVDIYLEPVEVGTKL